MCVLLYTYIFAYEFLVLDCYDFKRNSPTPLILGLPLWPPAVSFLGSNADMRAPETGYFPTEMTTGNSNDANESSCDVDGFRAFLGSMGVTTVKRMGTPRELASVSLLFQ